MLTDVNIFTSNFHFINFYIEVILATLQFVFEHFSTTIKRLIDGFVILIRFHHHDVLKVFASRCDQRQSNLSRRQRLKLFERKADIFAHIVILLYSVVVKTVNQRGNGLRLKHLSGTAVLHLLHELAEVSKLQHSDCGFG